MNFNQQNNTSIRFTTIQIINVNFTQVVIDSNISNLLSRLKVSFSELERLLKFEVSSDETKLKAIEINSTAMVLMDSINEVEISHRDDFSKKLIESCALIIEKYEEAEGKLELSTELRADLASGCISFFERQLGNYLNGNFWFDLKYYEWLLKEEFIFYSRNIYSQTNRNYFSDEHLEEFFKENRKHIIKRMLNESRDYNGNLTVSSPLNDHRTNTSFQAYKILPRST